MALLLEQWLILFLVLMLPTPGGFGARFGVFIVLICFVLPLLSFAMRAALAGRPHMVQSCPVLLAYMYLRMISYIVKCSHAPKSSGRWVRSRDYVGHAAVCTTVVMLASRERKEQALIRLLRHQSILVPMCEQGLPESKFPF